MKDKRNNYKHTYGVDTNRQNERRDQFIQTEFNVVPNNNVLDF